MSLVQYRVLSHLRAGAPAAAEPWEIAAALRLSPAHTTTVLAQMDDAGLVTRGPHPSDGRRRLVRLTAAGAERLELIDPLVTSPEQRLLSSVLSGDEARGLRELLRRVREHMATLSVPGIRSQVGP